MRSLKSSTTINSYNNENGSINYQYGSLQPCYWQEMYVWWSKQMSLYEKHLNAPSWRLLLAVASKFLFPGTSYEY